MNGFTGSVGRDFNNGVSHENYGYSAVGHADLGDNVHNLGTDQSGTWATYGSSVRGGHSARLVTLSQLVMVDVVEIMLETMLVGLRLIVVRGTRRHPVDLLLGVVIMIFVVLHLVDEEMAEEE